VRLTDLFQCDKVEPLAQDSAKRGTKDARRFGVVYFKMAAPFLIIQAAWIAFCVYWIWAARDRKKTARRQAPAERLLHVTFMAVGFILLYSPDPRFGVLNRRFLPSEPWIAIVGAALVAVGVGFAIWARRHIGKNWSGTVTIKQEHELIRTGPYAHIRHPIYTGILLAVAGTAIAIGEYRAIVALAVIGIGFVVKAKREESFLATQFGPAFDEHRRQTGFFLPR
jgi:protein-S-isoprenylcysteine O-methyltransferase Ste14